MKKVKFNIQGMTCSSCVSHVEKAVNKLNGIQSVNVNLLLNNMIVVYNESVLNDNKIIDAVVNAGYSASIAENNQKTKTKSENIANNKNSIKSMKKRLIISICFFIPLMYVAMHHMLYQWFGLPIPQIINQLFSGNENAINFAITQVLLLIPIVYVNRNYFLTGYKRLFKLSPNMDTLIAIGSTASILYGIFAIYMIRYRTSDITN